MAVLSGLHVRVFKGLWDLGSVGLGIFSWILVRNLVQDIQ